MDKQTLLQKFISLGWYPEADVIVSVIEDHMPSEAPSNPLNSGAYDYGFQLGYNAYRNELLKSLR
jgi:hypothetical protein